MEWIPAGQWWRVGRDGGGRRLPRAHLLGDGEPGVAGWSINVQSVISLYLGTNQSLYIKRKLCHEAKKHFDLNKNIFRSECVQLIINHMSLLALCSMSLHLPKNA